ncbi:MAG: hypothetical protein WC729_01875 [Sphingomonas sp.]|uniref:hypothetical protein n=1 Tax=Sphingomonas sp. TaxID=28214 RepID=UPI003568D91B
MSRSRFRLLLVIAATITGAAHASDHAPSAANDLLTLQRLDQRVVDTGYRLTRAATPFCGERMMLSGVLLHSIEEYGPESREDARVTFRLDDALAVLAVAHGSPAETAGLRVGDAILAVYDREVPAPATGQSATARVELIARTIERSAAATLDFTIRRGGARQRIAFLPEQGCVTHFWVRPSSRLTAEADGHDVEVTSGYVERAANDAALAIVLAHELAHNILAHRQRLARLGMHRGVGRYFGRSARLSREAELEADRLSVPIIGCAGYSLDDALAFRERLWRDPLADALLRAPDHPAARQRLDAIRQAIAAFRADPAPCRDQIPSRTN